MDFNISMITMVVCTWNTDYHEIVFAHFQRWLVKSDRYLGEKSNSMDCQIAGAIGEILGNMWFYALCW